ncbi:MAG: aspartate kinase [Polyangia bacterium]
MNRTESLFPEEAPAAVVPIVVQKYGGSSVADVEKLRLVARRVADTVQAGCRVVVVVSAMGKTTDELIGLARAISPAPPRRELDMLLTSGERVAMALLAMALHELGVPAISFTGSQSGILTNDRHSGARIIEVRPVRIQDELDRGRVVIVAGFQGMSYKREVTTLGRGGSDTTAVALAAALSAERCEIYSDVDGVYSADPRIVAEAHHLPTISYREMQELSDHGAKVLNAQAVEWAQRAGIVIHARKTSGSPRETRVGVEIPSHLGDGPLRGQATAVASCAKLVEIATPHGEAVLERLQAEGATLRHADLESPTEHGLTLLAALVTDDLPDWPRTRAAIGAAAAGRVTLREDRGTVTAVGPGLGGDAAVIARSLAALRAAGLRVERITTSPLRLTAWLPSAQVAEATRLWHGLLCAARS